MDTASFVNWDLGRMTATIIPDRCLSGEESVFCGGKACASDVNCISVLHPFWPFQLYCYSLPAPRRASHMPHGRFKPEPLPSYGSNAREGGREVPWLLCKRRTYQIRSFQGRSAAAPHVSNIYSSFSCLAENIAHFDDTGFSLCWGYRSLQNSAEPSFVRHRVGPI